MLEARQPFAGVVRIIPVRLVEIFAELVGIRSNKERKVARCQWAGRPGHLQPGCFDVVLILCLSFGVDTHGGGIAQRASAEGALQFGRVPFDVRAKVHSVEPARRVATRAKIGEDMLG